MALRGKSKIRADHSCSFVRIAEEAFCFLCFFFENKISQSLTHLFLEFLGKIRTADEKFRCSACWRSRRFFKRCVIHLGMFCSGEDFDLTFGLMHTVEKSAEILVKTLSMRPDKLQTITPQNFRDLEKDFHVTLPEHFLYEK